MKIGDIVVVKDNLEEELIKLTFDKVIAKGMANRYVGTKQKIFALWTDDDDGQEYATIDLCCEIPVQCLKILTTEKGGVNNA